MSPHVARVRVVDSIRSIEFYGWKAEYFACGHATFTRRGAVTGGRICRRCSSSLPHRARELAVCKVPDAQAFL